MRPAFGKLTLFSAIVAALAVTACSGNPTAPELSRALITQPKASGDLIPCDSTVVTDGSCRNGYIIPW